MKAACKLCGAVIETPPDPNMDDGRERRELNAFWNRVAAHIDPRSRQCTANDAKLPKARYAATMADNAWFQRWRLLACVTTTDEKLVGKKEEWRDYLHTITSVEASMEPEPQPVPTPSIN
jgi:hypothetical protein